MKKEKTTTLKTVDELVDGWTGASGSNQHLGAIRDLVRYLSRELYEQYQPLGGKPPFWERLAGWLQNVSSKRDQQLLLELVPWLLFVGRKEMDAMYQAAFVGPISRWLIEEAQLDITAANLPTRLRADNERFDAELAHAKARVETLRAIAKLNQAFGILP